MKKIDIATAFKMTSPNPVTLVCTETPQGGTNLAAVSWWTYLSDDPLMLCFAMAKPSYSGELVSRNKKVILAMPGAEIAVAAFKCGTVSGREKDKAKEFSIGLMELPGSSIKIPVQSRLVFDCALDKIVETGECNLYICTITGIYGDESKQQVFAWNGYGKIAPLS